MKGLGETRPVRSIVRMKMKLYKYCSSERVDILDACFIRYTQPGAFNDPFETKPYIKKLSTPDEFEKTLDELLPEETKRMYDQLPELARRVFSFDFVQMQLKKKLENSDAIYKTIERFTPMVRNKMESKLNELLGILSLTEKPDNLLMWSHYASSHEGFVIGFDTNNRHFDERRGPNDELRYLRKVEYRDQRPQAPLTGLTGVDVFLVKSSQWAYEQEWRIMRALQEADKVIPAEPYPIHLFKFPTDAVVEVIFGCRMHESCKKRILRILFKSEIFKDVTVLQAVPDEKEFRIRFNELSV